MRHLSRPTSVRFARMLLALTLAACGGAASAQLPFFPGAEGFGGTFTGTAPAAGWFSDATIYHVTTLQDDLGPDGKGAPGTLRGAFREKTSNKIIVFDVAGTIQLDSSKTLDMKSISNYYIAGQTAPGPVTVYGNSTQITHSNDTTNSNVILRYMSFRKGTGSGADAITFAGGANNGTGSSGTNMLVDHVSASWSEDEVLSVANVNTNVTVQYSMLTDSLTDGHQYGSLIRPRSDSQVTFHHNLYGNDKSRNPRPGTYNNNQLDFDFRNNVIYNWSDRAGYTGGASEDATEYVNMNYVGNYLIAGPATPVGAKSTTAFTMDAVKFWNGTENRLKLESPVDYLALQIYQNGNAIDSDHDTMRDGADAGWNMFAAQVLSGADDKGSLTVAYPDFNFGPNSGLAAKKASPFTYPAVTTQSAADAYDQVIDHVGNWWWNRDVIDERIIGNVENNTQPAGGIPAESPVPSELTYVTSAAYPAAPIAHPAGYDADNDAMADAWEAKHGGNLVWNADFDNDGYINLVEFINELGEFPAPAPIAFTGGLDNRYAHIMNWKTNDGGITDGSNWQPSRYDEAQINSGAVVVDAVGQHAGVLKLGATAGSNGQLEVNSGWLEVADALVVGAHETGQGKLTLAGGSVTAQQVVVGFLGQLAGTGTLTADVTNSGAVLPGNSAGSLTIAGDYTQNTDGVLSIDLASAASFDKLTVDGDIALAGLLEVNLLGGYMPAAGATFDVLDWTGAASGAFELLALPDLNASLAWDTSLLDSQGVLSVIESPAILAGDYNDDGVVDAADYSVWRDALNSDTALPNETESLGTVDVADYDAWKTNFGMKAAGAGGATSAVPEPSVSMTLMLTFLFLLPPAWHRSFC